MLIVLIVPKQTPTAAELRDFLTTTPGFLETFTCVEERSTGLYDYQIEIMESLARFKAVLKSRQTGLSFGFAAEGLAKCLLKTEHSSVYCSYNMEDASEKIRHADMLFDSMPAKWRKKRTTQNKTSLEFTDGRGKRSRLISLPCREPRGKGKADVYLDELPFMRNSRRIYTAAVPIISRGGGTLTLGSTPLGQLDLFYEILEGQPQRYPQYARWRVPWWDCPEFCTDVAAARREAPDLTTDARVERFGRPTLRAIRDSLDLESFQQEYECVFQDAAVSYLPWELLIAASQDTDVLPVSLGAADFTQDEAGAGARAQAVIEALDDLEGVAGPLYAGYDVARRHDGADLLVVERVGDRFRVRLRLTLRNAPFRTQHDLLALLLTRRPDVAFLAVDASGLGMQLAEDLAAAFPERAEGVTFTAPIKQVLASTLKIALQGRALDVPAQRDLLTQLHSVKKIVTIAGNIRLDADHDAQHHADAFWALALALQAASIPAAPASGVVIYDEPVLISSY